MKHLKSHFSKTCGSIPFHKKPGNQNQYILCDFHFNSEECCILWAMASPEAATWFLNRNTCREWATSPRSLSIKDRDCGSIWDLLRRGRKRKQACSKAGLFGQGEGIARDEGCSHHSITAHPGKTVNGNDWSTICILFRSINRTLLKPVSQSPLEQHSRMKQYPGLLGLHFYALLQDYKYSS